MNSLENGHKADINFCARSTSSQ